MEELLFATDEECNERRNILIKAGVIKVGGKQEKQERKVINRDILIERGFVNPKLGQIIKGQRKRYNIEDGEYNPKNIITEEEYVKRKANYFYMIQEIFWARNNLKLDLGSKKSDDPDWFF